MISALESGFFRREIADAAFTYQREVDVRHKLIVGINAFQETDDKPLETLQLDDTVEKGQVARLRERKHKRDNEAVRKHLADVRRVAASRDNLMPTLIEAARSRCTVGEVMNALADVFGRYDGAARW
jgi:methylmalonyl-CoA mutase N-terminal domain/subunit